MCATCGCGKSSLMRKTKKTAAKKATVKRKTATKKKTTKRK